jgi:hypothetical protein
MVEASPQSGDGLPRGVTADLSLAAGAPRDRPRQQR